MIPPLAWLCLRVLARRPALVPVDVRLNFDARHAHLLHALSPPLWAALVQVYDGLPADLHYLTVSLADPHLSLLQEIPHTPRFSLLTLLDLPACPHLNDTSVVHLRRLHSLVALDASATSLSSYAIKVLAGTLLWVDDGPQRRGPWSLRILRLRFCDKIDDSVYSHLAKFPLLTVIDLRGTKCRPPTDEFKPSSRLDFFHPAPLAAAVDALEGANLYTSTNVFHLLINSLEPPKTADNDVMDKLHESTASQCSTRQPESDIISLESTPSMFYGQQPSRVPRPVKYDLVNDYRAVTYYKWAHLEVVARPPGFHDSELALYRTPPLWTTLEEHSTFLLNQMKARRSTTGEAVTHVASINRTERIFQINQGRIDALRESASARRRSMGAASSNTLESKQMPGVQGKNPFRRRSVSGAVGDLDRETKELMPISAVEIPKLPQHLKSGLDVKNRPNAVADAPKVKPNLIVGPPFKSAVFHSTWSGHSNSQASTSAKRKPSTNSPRTNVKKSRADGESVLSDKGKKQSSAQTTKSFDWNAWSTK